MLYKNIKVKFRDTQTSLTLSQVCRKETHKARNRQYSAQTITDVDYTNDIVLLTNTPAQVESLLHSLEWAAGSISLHLNPNKTVQVF